MNYYGKYFILAYDSKVAHIAALMLEWEHGIEELKYKSTPCPVSEKNSSLGVGNQTVLPVYFAFLFFGTLPGQVEYQG